MLRRLLIPVIYNPRFLLHEKLDESVIRAAHRALVRRQSGITDAFLFILCGDLSEKDARAAIARYGFPEVTVDCISTTDIDGEELDDAEVKELIDGKISRWLNNSHPAAVASVLCGEYDSLDMWWSGVEACNTEWDFLEGFRETLPDSHSKKAETWLEILAQSMEEDYPCWSYLTQFTLYAAALCEWLHGFEAASGNSYNNFDAGHVCETLNVDDFFLGFLLGQLEPAVSFDELLYNAETDNLSDIKAFALGQAVERERLTIRNALAEYFGSDTVLFWALYSSIWPTYKEPINDSCCRILGLEEIEYSEVEPAWMFVTDGWTESADGD